MNPRAWSDSLPRIQPLGFLLQVLPMEGIGQLMGGPLPGIEVLPMDPA